MMDLMDTSFMPTQAKRHVDLLSWPYYVVMVLLFTGHDKKNCILFI